MDTLRFVGTEIYFDDLPQARAFYSEILGLTVSEDAPEHHVQFDFDGRFLCLERRGVENYPSADKAVLFFEVSDLSRHIEKIGRWRFARIESRWAILHDPEGHNILLLEKRTPGH